jgi:hypothetical protein
MPAVLEKPVESDLAEGVSLAKLLESMTKDEMIRYADENMGLRVDSSLEEQAIKESLLKFDLSQKNNARTINQRSLDMSIDKDNPAIVVKFYNMQSPNTNLEFNTTVPRGFFGPKNKKGFKKAPQYNLFHGETYTLPYAIYEHLKNLTYVENKPVIDPATGMFHGTIPIIKPKYVLEPVISRDQLIKLAQIKE